MTDFENIFDADSQLEAPQDGPIPITAGTVFRAAGISLMTALTVVLGTLLYHYMQSRPWNLTEHTAALTEQVIEQIAANYVPRENIRVLEVVERGNDTGRWLHHTIEVIVPAHVDWLGVQELVRDALAEQHIAMNETAAPGTARRHALAVDRFIFGEVVFHPQAGMTAMPEEESVCREARERVRDAILQQGVSPGALSVEAIRPVEGQTVQTTRFTAFLSDALTPEVLHHAIAEAVQGVDLWTERQFLSEQRELVQVYYQTTLCVELLCIRTALTPPVAIETVAEEAPPALEETVYLEESPAVERDEGEAPPEAAPAPMMDVEVAEDAVDEVAPTAPARVAIILDDGGYGGPETARILELDNRLTLAILPDTPFARQTARDAAALGFEIMLHMPMQTGNNNHNVFPGELELTMTRAEIEERTRDCIAQFPEAVGVNNHTGAAFTADAEKMRWFLEVVREHGLYFIDSRTTARSRAYDVAVELGIPSASRDIFLDNSSDPDEIRMQLNELIQLARSRGAAIGIAHFRRNTVAVLAEELPKLESSGVTLTPASEFVR